MSSNKNQSIQKTSGSDESDELFPITPEIKLPAVGGIALSHKPTPYAFINTTGPNAKNPGRKYWAQFDATSGDLKFICWYKD